LYTPATAVRARIAPFTGTPSPKDEPLASNPPPGAAIDYVIGANHVKSVELSIYANGKLLRKYTSKDPAPDTDPGKSGYAPEWIAQPSRLETTRGMHRFVWPIRYPKPAALAEGDTDADGIWAPPGNYVVELVVDGRKFTQPLTVAPDPRVRLDADAYAKQFALARDVEAAQLELAAAQGEAKNLHKSIAAARAAKGANEELKSTLDAFDAMLVARAGIVDAANPHNAWILPPSSTTSLRFVGETLGKVAGAVDSADAAPTPDAERGYTTAKTLLDRELGEWKAFKATQLAAINARLKAAGQKALSTEAPKESPSKS